MRLINRDQYDQLAVAMMYIEEVGCRVGYQGQCDCHRYGSTRATLKKSNYADAHSSAETLRLIGDVCLYEDIH